MNHFKILFLFLLLFLTAIKVKTQTTKADSLITILNSNIHDTTYVQKTIELSRFLMYSNTDTAMYFAKVAVEVALKGNHEINIINAYNTEGVCYIVKAQYYDALSSLSHALDIGKSILSKEPENILYKRRLGGVYTNSGNAYLYLGQYASAIDNYLIALKYFEDINFENGMAISSSNIAIAYTNLLKYDMALEYNYKALEMAKRTDDIYSLTQSLNNLGSTFYSLLNYDSAYYYIIKSVQINEELQNEYELINSYTNIAAIFHQRHSYDTSLVYFEKAKRLCEKFESLDGLMNVNYMIAEMYIDKGDYNKASYYYKESSKFAKQTSSLKFQMLASERLAKVYELQNNYKGAYENFVIGSQIRDSIFYEESDARIADMEAKYRSEKKEEEIKFLQEKTKLQQAESKSNKIIFISIIVILILIIVLVIMSYRSYKHKQLAERRKIQQNAEQKVLNAVIETEYKERKRFAEDLHDSLGVLLSTLRLYINEIDNNTTSDERKELIMQSNSLLDDAITNARNISNNIMPAALKNNGLEIAIRSFCDKINSSGNIKIEVQSINFKKHYKNTVEITLYRILTEMINNTLKHADATMVSISLSEKANKLFVTYKDNGKGFDYKSMINSSEKGMGLDNTISRINSIGGICTIESKVGKGFFAGIEIEI